MTADPRFDTLIDRRGTHCAKWDMMQPTYGVAPDDGIAMWVADMDFRPPACVGQALQGMVDHGVFGYFGDDRDYRASVVWWMKTRHGWDVDPAAILTTHGLVNAVGLCVDTFTAPGDAVVLFTPVYHAFARVIRAAGRTVTECPMPLEQGLYRLDLTDAAARLTGRERMLILCSPHNPGGRVWTPAELRAIADFARAHDLILLSDEIHHDLVMPGHRHLPMPLAAPDVADRLVMLTSPSKTFNMAGGHTGQMIVPDPGLRARLAGRLAALGLSPNAFGLAMTTAAYSPEGAAWVDALMTYIAGNARRFDAGIAAIPGLRSMPLQSTYLAWVDFAGAGMDAAEFTARVERDARIAANHGPTFGTGGETFLRFNLGAPRAVIDDAVARLQAAFRDLQ
ncbi:MAG: pyridoxal phosphate-dependent aminotransferase [Rhodobacteraceae bacterium]|jgi:cystathionine beta-lyase|nr:pyridoxal phosphate-dependent aminotransferase [Paracoccaceae bacterium]